MGPAVAEVNPNGSVVGGSPRKLWVPGLVLALALNRGRLKNLLRSVFFFPFTLSVVTVGEVPPACVDKKQVYNLIYNLIFNAPDFRNMYLRRLRTVMDTILQGRGTTVGSSYSDFAQRLYKRDWQSHTSEIPLIYQHPIVPLATYSVFPITSSATPAPVITLPHYSIAYVRLAKDASAPADLSLTFSAKPSTLAVTALKKLTNGSFAEFPFDTATNRVVITAFNSSTTSEAMLIITNTSTSDNQSIALASDGSTPTVTTSTASSSGGGGGCFIATAAYGSYLHPKVQLLREFRDRYLLTNTLGRQLVALYYRFSPPLADTIARHDGLRTAVRVILAPVIFAVEHGVATIAALTLAAILMGGTVARRRRPVR